MVSVKRKLFVSFCALFVLLPVVIYKLVVLTRLESFNHLPQFDLTRRDNQPDDIDQLKFNLKSTDKQVARPCGGHMVHNQHYTDRQYWSSLCGDTLHKHSEAIKNFIKFDLPHFFYDDFDFDG